MTLFEKRSSAAEPEVVEKGVDYPVQFMGSIHLLDQSSSMASYRVALNNMLQIYSKSGKKLIPMTIVVFKTHLSIYNRRKTEMYSRIALAYADSDLYDGGIDISFTSNQDDTILALVVRASRYSEATTILWAFKCDPKNSLVKYFLSITGVLTVFGKERIKDGRRELVRGVNFSTLSLPAVAEIWNTTGDELQKFINHRFSRPRPRRLYSCAIDSFLDLTQEHFSLFLVKEIFPKKCSRGSFDASCTCAFCSSLGSFTKLLLEYAIIRSRCRNPRELMKYTNIIWNALIVRPETNLKPKGTINAAPQSIPQLLQCRNFSIAAGVPPVVGIWREFECPHCTCEEVIGQLLLPFDLVYLKNESNLQLLVENNLAMVSHSCAQHKVLLSAKRILFSEFVILNLNFDPSHEPDSNLLQENLHLGGSSYTLMGFIKHLGEHFVSVIREENSFIVLDDLAHCDDLLVSGPLLYCLKQLQPGKLLLHGVFFLLFRRDR